MSDKIKGFVVTFDEDVHEDYMKRVTDAMLCFKGVGSVAPVVSDLNGLLAKEQVRREYMRKIMDVLS